MKRVNVGPKVAFVCAAAAALAYWPAGCAKQAPGPGAGAPAAASAPDALVKSPGVPRTFLPHPAFAYAKAGAGNASIADIAERAAPSVVNVSSSRAAKVRHGGMSPFEDPFFRRFFGPGVPRAPEEREQKGLGSGVIVSEDGVILTNNHVVEDAETITVTLADDREFDASVVGSDSKSDLAVLKLKASVTGLQPIRFADSSRLRLGDVVLAIGNPFGVGQTITMGIVSAKGRANVGIVDYEDFIQTDAAINPGNSGGALVDMEGNLVGINTAILSRSGGYMGIGFAIPANMAKPIMQSLLDHGTVVRGWLGVGIQDIDKELAAALKLPEASGVLITEVQDDSPAARAGLKQGDVVVSLDGKRMNSTGRLRNAVAASGAKVEVKLEVLRNGKSQQFTVRLGELPEERTALRPSKSSAPNVLDGLTVEGLDETQRKRFDVPPSVQNGVVVVGVARGSNAARSGLLPGDVILEVNRNDVTGVQSFKKAYQSAKQHLLLLINRRGRNQYLVLKR